MRLIFVLLLLLPFSVMASNDCFEGQWVFNQKNSDNPEKFFKKLARKEKQKRRMATPKPAEGPEDTHQDKMPMGIPEFVFSNQNLSIEVGGKQLELSYEHFSRQLQTTGKSRPLSLKTASKEANVVIAGWDGKALVVETTTFNGTYIHERWTLSDRNTLKVAMDIETGLSVYTGIHITYLREEAGSYPDSCL